MSDNSTNNMQMQPDGEPVVENTRLPRMEDSTARPRRIKGKVVRMPQNPQPDERAARSMADATSSRALTDQEAPQQPARQLTTAADNEGYVRLRVRVENGQMSVVGSREVEGPLQQEEELRHGYAYEVTVDQQRIGLGAVPDMGVERSYPNPQGPPEQQGHHITAQAAYEFNVRVPKTELSLQKLPRTHIALYQVQPDLADQPLTRGLLGAQLPEVARLQGIPLEILPPTVQDDLRKQGSSSRRKRS